MSRWQSFINAAFPLSMMLMVATVCYILIAVQTAVSISGVEPSVERGNRISNAYSALIAIISMWVGSKIKPRSEGRDETHGTAEPEANQTPSGANPQKLER